MKWRPCLLVCASTKRQDGFTIVEFLVASMLGLLVMGLAMATTLANRGVYRDDIIRTRINQNIRSAIDIMALNIRQSGESLDSIFPAIMIDNGTAGAADELVLRRNLYENEIFNVCQAISAGTFTPSIIFAANPTVSPMNSTACAWTSSLLPYITTWNNYRTQQGGTVRAYIIDRTTRLGEFFLVSNVSSTASQMIVSRPSGTWGRAYAGNGLSAQMYLLEEFRFRVRNNVLELVVNADTSNIFHVVDGITDFQVNARMSDGSTKTTFGVMDSWPSIQSLEITMSGSETFAGKTISSSVTSRLFPRNILSK